MNDLDPTVQSSIVSAIGAAIVAFFSGNWWQKRKTASPTHCEKICVLMVNSFDKLLTALEVAGELLTALEVAGEPPAVKVAGELLTALEVAGEPPAVKVAIRDARDSIVTAKNYLGLYGADADNQN